MRQFYRNIALNIMRNSLIRQPLRAATFPKGEGLATLNNNLQFHGYIKTNYIPENQNQRNPQDNKQYTSHQAHIRPMV